ncbi:F0F1 ATP synthase subunit epsilon [Mycobacterium sp. AMU20-3851]|uniref:F0F1 ATP synthase subunit epsilon n=1 Tax=Mycobacterium sp. AMU20-3851 TaxID=3122055 RepID=UPI0037542326
MADLDVEIVAVERELWSGKATFVFTRTTAGEIGILPRHIPLVAQLVDDAMVRVEREGEDDLRIAVDGGFLSVTEGKVSLLVENAQFESEVDADAAKRDAESDDASTAAWGRARLRAVGQLD